MKNSDDFSLWPISFIALALGMYLLHVKIDSAESLMKLQNKLQNERHEREIEYLEKSTNGIDKIGNPTW